MHIALNIKYGNWTIEQFKLYSLKCWIDIV